MLGSGLLAAAGAPADGVRGSWNAGRVGHERCEIPSARGVLIYGLCDDVFLRERYECNMLVANTNYTT